MDTAPLTSTAEAVSFPERLAAFAHAIDGDLAAFLGEKRRLTRATAGEAAELVDALQSLVDGGGKRLRPALVHHAYLACGGGRPEALRPLALACELLHAYLLIHDDIMDHAETRRGRPTAHAAFRQRHRSRGWRGDGADYGRSMGILAGDLAASYAFELAGRCRGALAQWSAVEASFAAMAQEVICGQFLEIAASFTGEPPGEEELLRVLRLKSGRYSVERPVELGALAAGAPAEIRARLAYYGAALGEAFQLQDDLLGMFGDPATVGKPVGGDLAEGKYTFLVHFALEGAGAADRAFLESARGRGDLGPQEARRAVEILEASGARARVEGMVAARLETARESLRALPLEEEGRSFLAGLIAYSRERRR